MTIYDHPEYLRFIDAIREHVRIFKENKDVLSGARIGGMFNGQFAI